MRYKLTMFVGLVLILVVASVPAALTVSTELFDGIKIKFGNEAAERVLSWQQLIDSSKTLGEKEKLERVNSFFNQQIEFVDDDYLWGLNDYWATPLEVLSKGAGDCEDYAIAKYFTLRELGIADSKMRMTYVKALELNQAHMVLTFFETPRSIPLVLDNLISEIKVATSRQDLLPVYSFNGSGLWLAKTRGGGKRVGASSRLDKWDKLKERMLKSEL